MTIFVLLLLVACTEEKIIDRFEQENIDEIVITTKQTAQKHDVSRFEQFELQEVIDGDTIWKF